MDLSLLPWATPRLTEISSTRMAPHGVPGTCGSGGQGITCCEPSGTHCQHGITPIFGPSAQQQLNAAGDWEGHGDEEARVSLGSLCAGCSQSTLATISCCCQAPI